MTHGWESLTPTELAVAREIATGCTNAEAAQRLFIAPSTVRRILQRIYTKLGIRVALRLPPRWHDTAEPNSTAGSRTQFRQEQQAIEALVATPRSPRRDVRPPRPVPRSRERSGASSKIRSSTRPFASRCPVSAPDTTRSSAVQGILEAPNADRRSSRRAICSTTGADSGWCGKMSLYPNEVVPLQIDLAIDSGRVPFSARQPIRAIGRPHRC